MAVKIDVREGDANTVIQDICSLDWKRHRAVLFLDPYGMQVEWKTIEAIASTGAIDLWILFPLGIGLNRLLTKSGDIPESWRKKIDSLLGTTDWYDEFYEVKVSSNLFGEDEQELVKAKVGKIGEYFVERLRSAFPAVAKKPAVLRNSTNNPLYLLCFAVGSENERAQQIALRIANQLLKDIW